MSPDKSFEIVEPTVTVEKREKFAFTGEFRYPQYLEWYWNECARRPGLCTLHGWAATYGVADHVPEFQWRRHIMRKV